MQTFWTREDSGERMADVAFQFQDDGAVPVTEEDAFFLAIVVRARAEAAGGTTAGRILASQLELAATVVWRRVERVRLTRLQGQLVREAVAELETSESEAFRLSAPLQRLVGRLGEE